MRWSHEDDVRLREMWRAEATYEEICEALGRTPMAVRSRRQRLLLPARRMDYDAAGLASITIRQRARRAELTQARHGLTAANLGLEPAMSFAEIGALMGLTRERIRQIEIGALRKLRRDPLARELFEATRDGEGGRHPLARAAEMYGEEVE